MLNIGVLVGLASVDYYLPQVASDVEDHCMGHGEAPGWWNGTASSDLALFEEVSDTPHPRKRGTSD